MTIDPNATLAAIREDLRGIEHASTDRVLLPASPRLAGQLARSAAVHTTALLAHLDAGGRLPDAWQPFNAAPAEYHAQRHMEAAQQAGGDLASLRIVHAQIVHERDQLRHLCNSAQDAAEELADQFEQLRADLAATREQVTEEIIAREALELERNEIRRTLAQREKDADRDIATHRARIRELMTELRELMTENDENRTTSPTWSIANLAEAAADIADHAEPDMHGGGHEWRDGTARAIKAEADNQLRQIRNAIRELPTNAYNRHQLAAMLAVGAARYGTRRKDDDLAGRTANHLRSLAPAAPTTSTPANQ